MITPGVLGSYPTISTTYMETTPMDTILFLIVAPILLITVVGLYWVNTKFLHMQEEIDHYRIALRHARADREAAVSRELRAREILEENQ